MSTLATGTMFEYEQPCCTAPSWRLILRHFEHLRMVNYLLSRRQAKRAEHEAVG
ncbi:hypothetical protein PAXRUDRAFT_822136 [Paxillus rubicundulus Ve08.2h10]|uniref:Unplaced genomic scaffold scaffold_23, whole genome shotgun sequence n=1 Tax=Paxillus rubicundulus Ve08.2h10 TaxID=930991 RepID=A0A0D0ECU1_9AGAM|nr:hypothetical protein PAXRUDRAFT_822136 [Paxillus rubicundulus Ve08.2h10]